MDPANPEPDAVLLIYNDRPPTLIERNLAAVPKVVAPPAQLHVPKVVEPPLGVVPHKAPLCRMVPAKFKEKAVPAKKVARALDSSATF